MGNDRTLDMIAKAVKKLRKLDPDFVLRRNTARRKLNNQRNEDRLRLADYGSNFTDVERIEDQDEMMSYLGVKISAPQTNKPTHKTEPMVSSAFRYELNGVSKTILEWSQALGIPTHTIRGRLRAGWSVERALSTANNHRPKRTYTYNGQTKTLAEWAVETGICQGTLTNRLNMKWPLAKALTVQVGTVMGTKSHGGWPKTSCEAVQTSGVASRDTEPKQAFSEDTDQ